MKMRNLLFGVFLGLLAVVHSTPVSTLTEDDLTDRKPTPDDFLADEYLLPSLTTESPKRNATVPATQQPMSDSDMTEGSGGEPMVPGGEHDATTTPTSTTTAFPDDANQVPESGATSPSEPDEALFTDDDVIEDTTVTSTTPMFFLHEDKDYESTTPSVPHAQSSTSTPFPMPSDDFYTHSSGVTSPSESDEDLSTDNDAIEDTTVTSTTPMFFLHEDKDYESTTPSVPHAQSSTSTPFPMPSDDFSSHSSTTRAPESGVSSPSEQNEDLSTDDDAIEDTTVMSMNTMFFLHEDEHHESTTPSVPHAQSSTSTPFSMLADDLGSGSDPEGGSGMELPDIFSIATRPSMTSASTAETSTASSNSGSGLVEEEIIKSERKDDMGAVRPESRGQVQPKKPDTPVSPTHAGHSTPDWIIIVGFIVGVAALVLLCVAIATRDKWNGPRQATPAKANPTNQQRELEMETFLHKDSPRENGKAAEYTVIPLDELPEKYSSH